MALKTGSAPTEQRELSCKFSDKSSCFPCKKLPGSITSITKWNRGKNPFRTPEELLLGSVNNTELDEPIA